MSDEPEFKKVTLTREQMTDALRNTPVRHGGFPAELLARMKSTYDTVGRFLSPTLEHWELGFMKDTNPASELAIWEHIEASFNRYRQTYGEPTPEEQKQIVLGLAVISSAGEPETLNADLRARLHECWEAVI